MRLGIILATLIVLSLMTISYASHAEAYNTFITITQSKTCVMVHCADSRTLAKYDNSTQEISGKLVYSTKTNDYKRQTKYTNAINWYSANLPDKTIVFYQPDEQTLVRAKHITITPKLNEFPGMFNFTKSETLPTITDIRTTYQGVYVDDRCTEALVDMKYYPDLNPIIAHLAGGCKTDLGNKITHITEKTQLNFCGQQCQYEKFMADAKAAAKQYLINSGYSSKHYVVALNG